MARRIRPGASDGGSWKPLFLGRQFAMIGV